MFASFILSDGTISTKIYMVSQSLSASLIGPYLGVSVQGRFRFWVFGKVFHLFEGIKYIFEASFFAK